MPYPPDNLDPSWYHTASYHPVPVYPDYKSLCCLVDTLGHQITLLNERVQQLTDTITYLQSLNQPGANPQG